MKVINKYRALLFVLIFFLIGNMQAQNIEEYLKEAAENNPALKAKFSEYYASLEKVPQVGSLPDPKLAFGYFISPVETRVGAQEAKFSVLQMFPWFGTLKTQKNMAVEQAKIKYQQFLSTRNKVFFEVKKTWCQLYKAERDILLAKENIKILKSFEQIALKKYETGQTGMTDVIWVQLQIKEQETKLEQIKDAKKTLTVQFNLLLNKDESTNISVPSKILLKEFDIELLSDSLLQNPNYVLSQNKQKILEYQLKAAKLKGYPNLSVGIDYVVISPRNDVIMIDNGNDALMAKVGLSVPLYRGKYRAMKKEVSFQLDAIEFEQQAIQNELKTKYVKNSNDYIDAKRRVKLYREQIETSQQALNILLSAYISAGKDFYEVLKMQQLILKYQLSLEKAKVDQNISVANLELLINQGI